MLGVNNCFGVRHLGFGTSSSEAACASANLPVQPRDFPEMKDTPLVCNAQLFFKVLVNDFLTSFMSVKGFVITIWFVVVGSLPVL